MRLINGLVMSMLLTGAVAADPIDDSQALYDVLIKHSSAVADAILAPVSRKFARQFEAEVYEPIVAATNKWDTASTSGNYRSYKEFQPCLSAGRLLGYVTDEVIQHHLGNDMYQGTMKYRHFEPFAESLVQCEAQISAARAESAENGSGG